MFIKIDHAVSSFQKFAASRWRSARGTGCEWYIQVAFAGSQPPCLAHLGPFLHPHALITFHPISDADSLLIWPSAPLLLNADLLQVHRRLQNHLFRRNPGSAPPIIVPIVIMDP